MTLKKLDQESKKTKKKQKDQNDEIYTHLQIICKTLCKSLKFGSYEYDDILQESWIWAQAALPKYNPKYKLFNFLFTQVKYRLLNLKRDKYERRESPCFKCPLNAYKNDLCEAYVDVEECVYWSEWRQRNDRKKSLALAANGAEVPELVDYKSQDIPERLDDREQFIRQFPTEIQLELYSYFNEDEMMDKQRYTKMIQDIRKYLII